jgi:hypothetical protein
MSASKQDIKRWLKEGKEKGASHVIIALDTFDHDNYPVFVFPHENTRECVGILGSESMQSVDEIYDLSMSIEGQLDVIRAWNM